MRQLTKNLAAGDPAPLFVLPTIAESQTQEVFLAEQAGTPLVLLFYGNDDFPACRQVAAVFRDCMPEFQDLNTQVISISPNPPLARQKFAQDYQIPFLLLSDTNHKVSRQYGVCNQGEFPENPSILTYSRTAFLLDQNQRIVNIYSLVDPLSAISEIIADIKNKIPQESPRIIKTQAPVLLIHNVISPEYCRYLIHVWETEGNGESGQMRQVGDRTIGVIDYSCKIRRDHFVEKPELIHQLDMIMKRRVFPEIRKAFHFPVTRREGYKIGCYDGLLGGFFKRHRDNTTPGTAHRRFAMTLNLNAEEYEGGYLTFPEYGSHLYKPDTGSAVIFSCSLMHEATPVRSGRRFGLFAFFYGDQEAEVRQAYELRVKNDYKTVLKVDN